MWFPWAIESWYWWGVIGGRKKNTGTSKRGWIVPVGLAAMF